MAGKTVNPTRMELTRLKGRLKTARRGHKLLKDKRDELMKQFMDVVRRNRALRAKVEQGLKEANAAFTVAAALMGPEVLEEALSCPRRSVSLEVSTRNIMSVNVPVFTFQTDSGDDALLPYGFAQTSGELDAALEKMQAVFADMLELAQGQTLADDDDAGHIFDQAAQQRQHRPAAVGAGLDTVQNEDDQVGHQQHQQDHDSQLQQGGELQRKNSLQLREVNDVGEIAQGHHRREKQRF